MSRFLIVSFAGLALAFYHLSGGAEFQPPERPSAIAPKAAEVSQPRQMPSSATSSRIEVRSSESLNPTPVLRPIPKPPAQPFVRLNAEQTVPNAAPQRQVGSLVPTAGRPAGVDPADDLQLQSVAFAFPSSGLQIGTLAGGLGSITQTRTAPPPVAASGARQDVAHVEDIRHVRASRVNIRFGPGTEYPVVARLLANDTVHVLSDDASGWVLLSDPKSGQVGWIAASLLSAKGS